MFKLVVLIFAIHGGVVEPYGAFRNKQDFASEKDCKTFLSSKEGKASQARLRKSLLEIKGAKAKFLCTKIEEKEEAKPDDDGSI